jgi:hypothetical protein
MLESDCAAALVELSGKRRQGTEILYHPSSLCLLRNLHIDPVGVFDVQTGIVTLQGIGAALRQIARGGVPAEPGDSNGEVIHGAGRASMVERDEHVGIAEAYYAARLILADHREAEHLLVELDGPLQIRDMNADMIDVRVFEIEALLGSGGRSAGGQHRQALNQFSTAERALLEARDEMRNDGFHGDSFL